MNKAQALFKGAVEAAISLPHDADAHTADTAALEAFKAQGHDKRDYGWWSGFHRQALGQLKNLGAEKTPAERAEETAKPGPAATT